MNLTNIYLKMRGNVANKNNSQVNIRFLAKFIVIYLFVTRDEVHGIIIHSLHNAGR